MYRIRNYGKDKKRICSCGSRIKSNETYCKDCISLSQHLSEDSDLSIDLEQYISKIREYCEMGVKK